MKTLATLALLAFAGSLATVASSRPTLISAPPIQSLGQKPLSFYAEYTGGSAAVFRTAVIATPKVAFFLTDAMSNSTSWTDLQLTVNAQPVMVWPADRNHVSLVSPILVPAGSVLELRVKGYGPINPLKISVSGYAM